VLYADAPGPRRRRHRKPQQHRETDTTTSDKYASVDYASFMPWTGWNGTPEFF
jgi:hypothetical protein